MSKPAPVASRDYGPQRGSSVDDLAVAQAVGPVDDLDALTLLWPADDDPDALDAFVRAQRVARRSASRDALAGG